MCFVGVLNLLHFVAATVSGSIWESVGGNRRKSIGSRLKTPLKRPAGGDNNNTELVKYFESHGIASCSPSADNPYLFFLPLFSRRVRNLPLSVVDGERV